MINITHLYNDISIVQLYVSTGLWRTNIYLSLFLKKDLFAINVYIVCSAIAFC